MSEGNSRYILLSLAMLNFFGIALILYLLWGREAYEEEFVKISPRHTPEIIRELTDHHFRIMIKEDGSIWLYKQDQYKYAACCT